MDRIYVAALELRGRKYMYTHNDHTYNNNYYYFNLLTIRGLSLFFKILPISNTGDSGADMLVTVHFMYPKLGSFSNMEYYF